MNKNKLVQRYISVSLDNGKTFKLISVSDWQYINKDNQIHNLTFDEFYNAVNNNEKSLCYSYFYTYTTLIKKKKRIQAIELFDYIIKEELVSNIIIKEEYKQEYKPTIMQLAKQLNNEEFVLLLKDNQIDQIKFN